MRTLAGVAWQDRRNETGVGKTTEEAAIQGKDNEALNEGRSRENAEGTDAVMVGLTGPGRTTVVGGWGESSLKPRFVVPGMGQHQIVQLTSWPHSRIAPNDAETSHPVKWLCLRRCLEHCLPAQQVSPRWCDWQEPQEEGPDLFSSCHGSTRSSKHNTALSERGKWAERPCHPEEGREASPKECSWPDLVALNLSQDP